MNESFLPKDELKKMRRDVDTVKGDTSKALENNVNKLSATVGRLLDIFEEANEELKEDGHDAVLVSEKLDEIVKRLDKIERQNEKIAKGVVAVADMVEELQSQAQRPAPQHIQHRQAPQRAPRTPPQRPPSESTEKSTKPLPRYPPPKEEKKKSFF